MTTRQTVSEFVWADIRSPQEVPTRLRRQVEEAFIGCWEDPECREALTNDGDISLSTRKMLNDLSDLSIVALVENWSFGDVDREVLLEIPSVCAEWVAAVCAPHATGLIPQLATIAGLVEPRKGKDGLVGRASNKRVAKVPQGS